MSEIKFSCPVCGQNVLCDTSLAGVQLACPNCNAIIGVPKGFEELVDDSSVILPELPENIETTDQKNSRLAVASLVCSLSSLITCIGWLPGIICGHLAKSRIRRNPSLKGNDLATAGLIIGYLILVLEVGNAAFFISHFSAAMKQGYENVRQNLATNNVIVRPMNVSNPPAAINPQSVSADSEWTIDISNTSFPDHPAGGKIHGMGFTVKTATFRSGSLRINSTNGLSLEIFRGLGDSLAGQSYEVQPNDDDNATPRVRMTWNDSDEVQSTTFSKGYGMKLKFAQAVNRKIAAKIYLCLPDDSKSYVAGTFEVRLPKLQ